MSDVAPDASDALDALVAAVCAAPRYRDVEVNLVRRVGARELAKGRRLQEAVKATKSKLHQVGGAYLDQPRYATWLAELRAAYTADGAEMGGDAGGDAEETRRTALRRVMARHASTRERLPILDAFYSCALAPLAASGPLKSVVDVACGLNPLALPWLPLAEGARLRAYDIYGDLVGFLNGYFALAAAGAGGERVPRLLIQAQAEARDVVATPPDAPADLALILKALPCLEQIDPLASERLLRALRAERLLVSFPVRSLGGRGGKGMEAQYEERFMGLLARIGGGRWQVERFSFASELAFLVSR